MYACVFLQLLPFMPNVAHLPIVLLNWQLLDGNALNRREEFNDARDSGRVIHLFNL